tara:strand:- start:545 stop:1045 length:501 start_codon:yes stop_codon:yes gene_type:complete
MVIEVKDFISKEQQKTINFSLSDRFPYYWFNSQVDNDFRPYLGHILVSREDHTIQSTYALSFIDIFISCLKKTNLSFKCILRANINILFPVDDILHPPLFHRDHTFGHKQFIMYFNDCDGDLELLYNGVSSSFTPKKNTAILMDNLDHRAFSPSKGRRVSFIVTYD